jgi:hypothetical protein
MTCARETITWPRKYVLRMYRYVTRFAEVHVIIIVSPLCDRRNKHANNNKINSMSVLTLGRVILVLLFVGVIKILTTSY